MTELGDGAFGTRSLVDLPATIQLLRRFEVTISAQRYEPRRYAASIVSKHRAHSVARNSVALDALLGGSKLIRCTSGRVRRELLPFNPSR
jgi:hypothetical protein